MFMRKGGLAWKQIVSVGIDVSKGKALSVP